MVLFNGVAKVIGISNYENLTKPANVQNDSNAISNRLRLSGYDVIHLENPSREQIMDGLIQMRNKILDFKYREVIIYYAGYGACNEQTQYILLPEFGVAYASLTHQLDLHGISVDEMLNVINLSKPEMFDIRSIVVILDTCREIVPRNISDINISYNLIKFTRKKFELCNDARTGKLVAFACERGLGVQYGEPGGNGVYTGHLLEHIFIPEYPIMDALGRVHQLVVETTSSDQKPQIEVNFPHFFNFSLNKGPRIHRSSLSCNDVGIKTRPFYM